MKWSKCYHQEMFGISWLINHLHLIPPIRKFQQYTIFVNLADTSGQVCDLPNSSCCCSNNWCYSTFEAVHTVNDARPAKPDHRSEHLATRVACSRGATPGPWFCRAEAEGNRRLSKTLPSQAGCPVQTSLSQLRPTSMLSLTKYKSCPHHYRAGPAKQLFLYYSLMSHFKNNF